MLTRQVFSFSFLFLDSFDKLPKNFSFILCILPIDFFYFWRYNKYVNWKRAKPPERGFNMKKSIHRINIRTIRNLANNAGMTLQDGYMVTFKTGWQVALSGAEFNNADDAMDFVRKLRKMNEFAKKVKDGHNNPCVGIWFSDGIYYIDLSYRYRTKKEAIEVGQRHNQLSIFSWERKFEPVLFL